MFTLPVEILQNEPGFPQGQGPSATTVSSGVTARAVTLPHRSQIRTFFAPLRTQSTSFLFTLPALLHSIALIRGKWKEQMGTAQKNKCWNFTYKYFTDKEIRKNKSQG